MSSQPYTRTMQRGGEADHEVAPKRNGHLEALQQPGGYLWPALRVGRAANYAVQGEWDLYLSALGRKNQKRGHVMVLGEIGCHYITDTEFRGMILAKYPDIRHDRKAAFKLYESMYRSTKDFIDGSQLLQDRQDRIRFGAPRPDLMGKALLHDGHGHRRYATNSNTWNESSFDVREHETFSGYSGNVIGIDLSQHRELYEERTDVLRFLQREEKLDVRPVRSDWSAHATVFRYHAHLTYEAEGFSLPGQGGKKDREIQPELPPSIILEAPRVDYDM